VRTVHRHQRRYAEGGMAALGREEGWRSAPVIKQPHGPLHSRPVCQPWVATERHAHAAFARRMRAQERAGARTTDGRASGRPFFSPKMVGLILNKRGL
jgi:hypothetical protein